MTLPLSRKYPVNAADRILDAVEGAVIVCGYVEDDGEGMCLELQDGRTLVIAGYFGLSLVRFDRVKLH